ncbi:MAG: 50S ribosomal protein L24 [Flavobacteriales bacterium Tduv]
MSKLKIKTGDEVVVLAGNHKDSKGFVLKVFPKKNRAIVGGVNMIKKHVKPTAERPKGGIVEKENSLHISNLAVLDLKEKKPTRIGYQMRDGKKVRITKKSGEVLRDEDKK